MADRYDSRTEKEPQKLYFPNAQRLHQRYKSAELPSKWAKHKVGGAEPSGGREELLVVVVVISTVSFRLRPV